METASSLPQVNHALCTLCGACVEACPCHAITMGEDGPVFECPVTCPQGGDACAGSCQLVCACEETCPTGAIECPFEIVLSDEGGTSGKPDTVQLG
jgi:formate hydrogenlyase subunit 6/NADH:ubiquinone oxidoreductase subunit I